MTFDKDSTVADVVAHLLTYPQDAKPAALGGFGGSYRPLEQIGFVELVSLVGHEDGKEVDRMTVRADSDFAKSWKGAREEPFIAVIFD